MTSPLVRSAVKIGLLIGVIAVALAAGSALATLNNACKSSHHAWCVQRHHAKAGHS